MASAYPGGLDSFATNKADATTTPTDHPGHHNDLADAVNKIEAELGVDPAGAEATVVARLDAIDTSLAPVYDIEKYTAGDISVTSTTAGAALPGAGTVTVAAATGDLLMVGVGLRENGSHSTTSMRVDVASIVSAAAVNYLSSGTGTPASTGVAAWYWPASQSSVSSGELPYVVQAGDISAGTVTLGIRAWLSIAGTFTVSAVAAGPLVFWVRNLGQ